MTEKQKTELVQQAQNAFWVTLMNRIDPNNQHDLGGWASVSQMENDEHLERIAKDAIEDFLGVVQSPTVSKYVAALRLALAFVKDQRLALETEKGRYNHDGVVIAAELMEHAAAINAAYAADHGPFQSPGDRITGEAGFLAGYWYTVALLQVEGDWLKTETAWLDHAASILTDEIGSNTPSR